MAKASEVIAGIFVGIVVWLLLWLIFALFAWIPIIGWIIGIIGIFLVPMGAGYVAGKVGGVGAAIALAFIAPVSGAIIGFYAINLIPIAFLRQILGTAWGIIVGVWVIFNLIFVGVGGAIGSAARPKPQKPIKVEVQVGEKSTSVPNVEGTSKPVIAEPEMETRSGELVWTKEGRLLEIDVLRKRVLGYLLAYKKAELKTLASKFDVSKTQIEEIIFELIADGKIKGVIDPETETFHVKE